MIPPGQSYVPTLAVRASEMNGLEFLPGATKDRMLPCFLLAPWASSNTLEKAIERIERAYRNRHYILDIDRDYEISNLDNGPQAELAHLRNRANGYQNWVEFVAQHEWVFPCIQSVGLSEAEIAGQVQAYRELGRPYCLRIVRDRFPANIDEIVRAVSQSGAADFAVILEGGWTRDPLTLAAWFSGVVSSSLSQIDANVPIVVSCTSIPRLFSEFQGITEVQFNNRELVQQVQTVTNRNAVVYGDWGSTRPREAGGFATKPIERIDYPLKDAWYIARDRDSGWGFERAASAIVGRSDVWDGGLSIWGEEMIFQTTVSPALGINTPQKNVASRVNIHLHRQAFYRDDLPPPQAFDEDWED